MKVPGIVVGMGTYDLLIALGRHRAATVTPPPVHKRQPTSGTARHDRAIFEELWDKRPLAESIPPRALAEDKIAWSGDEAAVFGVIFDRCASVCRASAPTA